MAERTLTAMFDTRGAAEAARDDLVALGVPSGDVTIRGADDRPAGAETSADEDRGFWGSIADALFPEEDHHTYAEGVRRGGYLLTARVPEGMEDQALDVLERHEPVDLNERAESWRRSGWAGYQAGSTGSSSYGSTGKSHDFGTGPGHAGVVDRVSDAVSDAAEATGLKREDYDEERRGTGTGTGPTGAVGAGAAGVSATGAAALSGERTTRDLRVGEEAIPVVEEQVRVGKREVGRGSVRVRSYVVERPVEEQVSLRQERVTVERVPVDREIAAGEAPFSERTIEAVERGEEAVIDKRARVTGEVRVRKDVDERTETVRDTVRKTEVKVEDDRGGRNIAGTGEP